MHLANNHSINKKAGKMIKNSKWLKFKLQQLSKNLIQGALVAVLGFGALLALAPAGSVHAYTGSGTGVSGDPYLITSCAEFMEIDDDRFAHYELTTDLDCSGDGNSIMMGDSPLEFEGDFDGGNYTITVDINATGGNVGLFRIVGGTIANLSVAGSVVSDDTNTGMLAGAFLENAVATNVHSSGSVFSTSDSVGGLVGDFYCLVTLEDSSSSATIEGVSNVGGLVGLSGSGCSEGGGGLISNSFATGEVTGTFDVGGLLGEGISMDIEKVYATGDVNASDYVGGLIGRIGAVSVSQSFATGDVYDILSSSYRKGGLIGYVGSFSTLEDVFARGNVDTPTSTTVGGITSQIQSSSTITNAYSTGALPAGSSDGAIAGRANGDVLQSYWDNDTVGLTVGCGVIASTCDATGKTTAEMKTQSTFVSWDFSTIWTIDPDKNDGYPYFAFGFPDPIFTDDNDGVEKSIEDAAPNSGDANNDGTSDSEQPKVTSLVNIATSDYTVLEASTCTANNTVSVTTESEDIVKNDDDFDYPAGLLNFTLTGCISGGTETITQYHYGVAYDNLSDLVLRKHNPTDDSYITIESAVFSEETIGGKTALKVVYQVTDGGPLDQDNIANGEIVDPAGVALGVDTLAETGAQAYLLPMVGLAILGGVVTLHAKTRNSRKSSE